ncbi:MAG TPA: HNH endonuclease [Actinospica sp.]|nr:HNH endonuclease [Actinospica sp.]
MPAPRTTIYTPENLSAAVAESTSYRGVMRYLGLPLTGGGASHLARRIQDFDIDVSHFSSLRPDAEPLRRVCRDELSTALSDAHSLADLARRLDLPVSARTRRHLVRLIDEYGLSTAGLGHQRVRLEPDRLRATAHGCTSVAEVIRRLGLAEDRTNHRRVRRALTDHGIDTSHFVRASWAAPRARTRKETRPEDILRVDAENRRTPGKKLSAALAAVGVPSACAACGMDGVWQGRRITLEVDHINGDFRDNRRENLRLLCPNCHAATTTYCRRKQRPAS